MLWALALPGALVVGFSMGLFGSGGSILTVPILVYLLGWEEKIAIASSLAIVGLVALITSLRNLREGTIDCLLYTSPSPRDATLSRMPSSA